MRSKPTPLCAFVLSMRAAAGLVFRNPERYTAYYCSTSSDKIAVFVPQQPAFVGLPKVMCMISALVLCPSAMIRWCG